MKRFLILSTVVVFFVGLLAGLAVGDDWPKERARAALAFAKAQETEDKPEDTTGKCPDCYGTGKRGDGRVVFKCPTCNGTGKKTSGEALPPAAAGPDEPADEGQAPEPKDPGTGKRSDPEVYGAFFTADWCGTCRTYKEKEADRVLIDFETVDVTDDAAKAERSNVVSLPAFFICDRDLQTVLERVEGYQTADQMNALIESAKRKKRERQRENEPLSELATVLIRQNFEAGGKRLRNSGSGTIIDLAPDGRSALVLTCSHIFEPGVDVATVSATMQGVEDLPGLVIARDDVRDLAAVVVQLNGKKLKALGRTVGKNETIGTPLYVMGHPGGRRLMKTATRIVSTTKAQGFTKADRLVLAGQPGEGNSGGGVFIEGTLVGVYVEENMDDKQGWSVRADHVREFLETIE